MFKRRRDESETGAAPAAPQGAAGRATSQGPGQPPGTPAGPASHPAGAQPTRADTPIFPPRPPQARNAEAQPAPVFDPPFPTKDASAMTRPPNAPPPGSGPAAPPASAMPAKPPHANPPLPGSPLPGQGPAGVPGFDRPTAAAAQPAAAPERRTLIVSKGVSLQGIIKDAERLVIEGTVEAEMLNVTELAIQPGGVFKGEINAEVAEIAGLVDGTVSAHASLTVTGTGRIVGVARCRRLQVENGGQISGKIEMLTGSDGTP